MTKLSENVRRVAAFAVAGGYVWLAPFAWSAQPSKPQDNAEAVYHHAREMLNSGDYSASGDELASFLARFPTSQYGLEANYWLGRVRDVQGRNLDATGAYARSLQGWPQADWSPDAAMRLASNLVTLKRTTDACHMIYELDTRYLRRPSAPLLERRQAVLRSIDCSKQTFGPVAIPESARPPTAIQPDGEPKFQSPVSGQHPGEVVLEDDGGTFVVPVLVNDAITLKFTLDSGASYVAIPSDVVSTLVRTGTLSSTDFIGSTTVALADGTLIPSARFKIRSLKVGNVILSDVVGIVSDQKGSLLLGQSFLSRLAGWSIDNRRHVLLMN